MAVIFGATNDGAERLKFAVDEGATFVESVAQLDDALKDSPAATHALMLIGHSALRACTMDRLDREADNSLTIVDYKTGRAPNPNYLSSVFANTELYAAAAEAADAPDGTTPVLRGPVVRRLSAEQVWDSLLVLLVPDPDERRARMELEHAELNPARLAALARMNADELLRRAEVELD